MTVHWKTAFDLTSLLSYLESNRSQDSGGQVTYKGFSFNEDAFLLSSAVQMNPQLSVIDKERLATQALFSSIPTGTPFKDGLLEAIDRKQIEYYRLPAQDRTTITSLTIHDNILLPPCRIAPDVRISFPSRLPPKALTAREHALDDVPRIALPELPKSYRPVVIKTRCRTQSEAIETALDGIDLLRALWNLYLNRSKGWRWSMGRPEPVNPILLGFLHTLHQQDGSLESQTYWYQPEYQRPMPLHDLAPKRDGLLKFTKRVRALLARSPYKEVLRQALLQYVRALDRPDMQESFQRLWAILELLTSTTSRDLVVRRASALWQDSSLARLTLENLRELRNGLVHEGKDAPEGEICVFQAKRHVEALLEFHLGNRFKLNTLEEVGELLDLHRYLAASSGKVRIFKAARRYYAPRPRR